MKLGIVIPLKSKTVSQDWQLVQQNLMRTIRSITNQTINNFQLVIVGHESPEYMQQLCQEGNISFVELTERKPPTINNSTSPPDKQKMYDIDKSFKVLKGFIYLNRKQCGITHWFSMDADDLLHREFIFEITKLVNNDTNISIVFNNGYFYYEKYGVFNKTNVFSLFCGSSCILGDKHMQIPDQLSIESLNSILFNRVSHTQLPSFLSSNNYKYHTPKKKLVMYIRDNGENISAGKNQLAYKIKRYLKMILRSTRLNKSEKQAFGLEAN